MQLPADPCRELLRLWPRQQVTEIEGAQILSFIDPAAIIDDFAVHQGDLPGGPAEAEATDARKDADQFAQSWCGNWFGIHATPHIMRQTISPVRIG